MSARGGVVEAVRATELMRLKAAGVPIGERFRRATRNGALRAAVFGVNDGLVSSLALIMGLTGAGTGRAFILLAGTAGLLAGALSMAAGEYVSVRVQREVGERVLRDERAEIARDPAGERAELAAVYRQRGFSDELAERMAAEAMANPALALEAHVRDELSIDPDHLGWPWGAAASSFITFAFGAAVPLLPFAVAAGTAAIAASVSLSLGVLFGIGGIAAALAGRPVPLGAARMLAIGGGAATLTFLIGSVFGVAVG